MSWTLVIHGGCGAMRPATLPPDAEDRARAGLEAALDAGEAVLRAGGSALDAVEAAARVLEEDPAFNAGRGSVLTAEGQCELDAAIMDGRDRRAGAVAGMTTTRSPISAARAAMEHSPHVLLTYDGADAFAREQGLEQVANQWFIIPERQGAAGPGDGGGRQVRYRDQIWHDRRGCRGFGGACRGGDIDRRADRQALGADR